jgi:serine/threonine-protein kinase Chk2
MYEALPILENTVDEDFDDLPCLDSPAIAKSENVGEILKPANLGMMNKRGLYKNFKQKSAPLLLESRLSSWSKFKITDYYKLDKRIGSGTYGEVRLAYDIVSEKTVAIKIAKGTTSRKYLENEASILKDLDHECFPKFINLLKDDRVNKSYLVMDYVEGWTLDSLLDDQYTFSSTEVVDLISKLANGVQYLHSNGICHRDIKPQNIMVSGDKLSIKIIDFNISKSTPKKSACNNTIRDSKFYGKFFTQISSPLYAAPELNSRDCYSESVDIWGLGIAFYCMVYGTDSLLDYKTNYVLEKENAKVELDDNISSILSRTLDHNAENRPTVDQLVEMLA